MNTTRVSIIEETYNNLVIRKVLMIVTLPNNDRQNSASMHRGGRVNLSKCTPNGRVHWRVPVLFIVIVQLRARFSLSLRSSVDTECYHFWKFFQGQLAI